MSVDPCITNPDHYKVIFENDRVRVLEYKDKPGDKTTPHAHPDSLMYTRSAFRRRLGLAPGWWTRVTQRAERSPAGVSTAVRTRPG